MKKIISIVIVLFVVATSLSSCVSSLSSESPLDSFASEVFSEDNVSQTQADTIPVLPVDSTFQIHFLDVGQADAALVLCDGEAMLIDAGNAEDSSLIYSYLDVNMIHTLKALVVTHGHEDHCGGASGAATYATVETAYCSVTEYDAKAFSNFVNKLDAQGVTITVPSPGDSFTVGSSRVTILGPVSVSDDPNNMSIVLKIQYRDTSFLFTGDAELDEESDILDAGYDISCDVLKVGHHGSSTSTGYRWLREAAPEYAVISCEKDNSYGHPHEETLSKLRDADVSVFRTDLQGHIICTSDGTNITFEVQRNANVDTLAGAGEGGNHLEDTEEDTTVAAFSQDATYICNTRSLKFHYPDCASVADMSEKNRLEVTATRDELISQGYQPCGRCNP